jgi:MtaA/CmuA family methyltransferase
MTGKERILKALAGEATDSLPLMPITMMFAGDTAGIRYGEYARDHRKMVEAQLRVAEKYDIDYVSVISDPAREAADLGATVEWFDDQPPAIVESRALIDDKAKLKSLRPPDMTAPGRMRDRIEGIGLFKRQVGEEKLIEGWVEGPCAQAADLRGLNTLMIDFSDDPEFVEALFEFIVGMELEFAKAQVEAGADLIGVGDAASSLVGPRLYERRVFPFEQRLVKGIQAMGAKVRLHICGNTRKILRWMGECGADMVDLDYLSPVSEGRAAMGPGQVIAGNLDPVRALRDGTPESVKAAIAECHAQAGARYIVAAGCEVPRGTPEANLRAMTEYARSH